MLTIIILRAISFIYFNNSSCRLDGAHKIADGGADDERHDTVGHVDERRGAAAAAEHEEAAMRQRAGCPEQGGGATQRGLSALYADTGQQGQPE